MDRFHHEAAAMARAARANSEEPYAIALSRGTLELGYYTPVEADRQTPHAQDEVYVIVRGSGRLRNGDATVSFGPGDALFVPAGVEHRFVEFTEDIEMWVVFYGPEGGEGD